MVQKGRGHAWHVGCVEVVHLANPEAGPSEISQSLFCATLQEPAMNFRAPGRGAGVVEL